MKYNGLPSWVLLTGCYHPFKPRQMEYYVTQIVKSLTIYHGPLHEEQNWIKGGET